MVAAGSISILLVDDDNAYCHLLARSLDQRPDLHVLIANCGATALELSDQADIALVDMIMPGLSGVETIPLLRCSNPDLKMIACSGSDEELFRDDLDHLGVERFLSKPFPIEMLLNEIDYLLREDRVS